MIDNLLEKKKKSTHPKYIPIRNFYAKRFKFKFQTNWFGQISLFFSLSLFFLHLDEGTRSQGQDY